jgi:4-amino-4-deoxy-L-arabinose transferase-like glycosyltransferase
MPPAGARPSPDRHFRLAVLILVALTVVRLIGLHFSAVDLFFDESQYWAWSREPALGYFSKPPLLAWMIAVAEQVCGPSEACIRAPAPLMGLATGLFAYAAGRALYDARTGFWAAMLTAFGTGTVFSARIISTDVPLVMFSALALFAYARLLEKPDWRPALLLGFAIGAGLLAKYAMVYMLPGLLLAAAFDKRARALLARRELWLALGVALAVASPNLAWNAAHGFLAFRHAGGNISGEPIEPSLLRPLEFLASQFAVFGPVVFGVAIAAVIALARGNVGKDKDMSKDVGKDMDKDSALRPQPQDRVLLAFALPALAAVTATATVMHAYANWAAMSFIPLAVLAAAILVRQNLRLLLWGSLALGLWAQVTLIGADAFASRISLPFLAKPNPYFRTLGWSAYGRAVGELARKRGISVIATDTRAEVASLLYYWRDQPERIVAWATTDELPAFEITRGLTAAAPQPVLFVSQCQDVDRLEAFYAKVTPLGVVVPDGPMPRAFAAFTLEEPRGPLAPLAPCRE